MLELGLACDDLKVKKKQTVQYCAEIRLYCNSVFCAIPYDDSCNVMTKSPTVPAA